MIAQFVPSEYCLKCKGCCRFREELSAWRPCLLEEEIQELLDKDIPLAAISQEKKIMALPASSGEGFVCPFLELEDNKCKIYKLRPFECQLYPFLINLRHKKVILTVDLNCPYVTEQIKLPAFKEYAEYLADFLNSPRQIRMLKDNPQLLEAYEEVADIVELNL